MYRTNEHLVLDSKRPLTAKQSAKMTRREKIERDNRIGEACLKAGLKRRYRFPKTAEGEKQRAAMLKKMEAALKPIGEKPFTSEGFSIWP